MAGTTVFDFNIVPEHGDATSANATTIAKHPQQFYDGADIAWMMTSAALVFLMIAGICLLHGGLSDEPSAIRMFRLPFLTTVVVGCQWFLFGYSLAFSEAHNDEAASFIGGSSGLAFEGVLINPVGNNPGARIPEIVYAFYQQMFACFTATLVSGAAYRNFRTIQFLLFIFIWTTVVYDPIARWSWHPAGWSKRRGSLDFAGGTVVHSRKSLTIPWITGGAAVQAFAIWYGFKVKFFGGERRAKIRKRHLDIKPPYDPNFAVLGTTLVWIGWFGFNGGSALGANSRAAAACMSTQLAACFGALTGLLCYLLFKKFADEEKSATQAICDGAITGLVAITPGAGYVPPRFAPVFGIVASASVSFIRSLVAYAAEHRFKNKTWPDIVFFRYDLLEVGLVHAASGFIGMFLTGVFNRPEIFELDGFSTAPERSGDPGVQLARQMADAFAGWAWSFFLTLALLCVFTGAKFTVGKGSKEERDLRVVEPNVGAEDADGSNVAAGGEDEEVR